MTRIAGVKLNDVTGRYAPGIRIKGAMKKKL